MFKKNNNILPSCLIKNLKFGMEESTESLSKEMKLCWKGEGTGEAKQVLLVPIQALLTVSADPHQRCRCLLLHPGAFCHLLLCLLDQTSLKGSDVPCLLSNLHHGPSAAPLLDNITLLALMSNTSTSVLAETLL